MFTIGRRFEGAQGTRTSWGCANGALVIMGNLRECVGPCIFESMSLGQTSMLLGRTVPVTLWQRLLCSLTLYGYAYAVDLGLGEWARGPGWRWVKWTSAGGKCVAVAAFNATDYRAKVTSTLNYNS